MVFILEHGFDGVKHRKQIENSLNVCALFSGGAHTFRGGQKCSVLVIDDERGCDD